MALDEVAEALVKYFKGRAEYVPRLKAIREDFAIRALVKLHQENLTINDDAKTIPFLSEIIPENMAILSGINKHLVNVHKTNTRKYASLLYGFDESQIYITSTAVMLHANTLPIKVNCMMGDRQKGLEKTFYIKKFDVNDDISRICGLELYRMMSGYGEQLYKFGKDIILEDNVEGKEPEIIDERLCADDNFIKSVIRNQILVSWIGLDDVFDIKEKSLRYNNCVISPDNSLKLIDFDRFGGIYSFARKQKIRQDWCSKFGISEIDYINLCRFEEKDLLEIAYANLPRIYAIAQIMSKSKEEFVKKSGDHIPLQMRYIFSTRTNIDMQNQD